MITIHISYMCFAFHNNIFLPLTADIYVKYTPVRSLPDDGLVEAETCSRDTINDKSLLIIDLHTVVLNAVCSVFCTHYGLY